MSVQGVTHKHKKSPQFKHGNAYKIVDFAVFEPFFTFFDQNSQNEH